MSERGVRVRDVQYMRGRDFQVEDGGGLGEKVRGQRPDDVDAQHLAILFVGNHFDEAAMVAENRGLAVADEGKLAGFHRIPRLAGLLFRQADGADLRLAVGGVAYTLLDAGWRGFTGNVRHRGDTPPPCR